ncbi:hypothetical protein DOY81_010040 [Sarcophaga bullata]|nr:hypothetical protein DOY81_010040 [Sarcophaga bullata]
MFGDLGHGFILTLFGAWMCMYEKRLCRLKGGEIWNIFFGGRYIILLMGLFSCYTGLIYNDVFSKSMNIFGSTWTVRYNTSTVLENPQMQMNPEYHVEGVYPLGLDPIWQLATNKIIFLNTYKMKLSIITGVLHMIFGVCMSVVNFVHFKRVSSIVLEFLPQILFLVLLFGYMVFMMFFKWVQYSAQAVDQPETPGCAPSVLIMFINMMLFKSTPPLLGCKEFMFEGQNTLQMIFVFIALRFCIPWMLLGKPLYIMFTRKNNDHVKHNGELTGNMELNEGETQLPTAAESHEGGAHGHDDEQ